MRTVNSVFNRERYPYCKWWNIPAHIKRLYTMIRDIYWRAKYGFTPYDTWDLDDFLGDLMYDSITYFEKNRHGFPTDMTDEQWAVYLSEMAEAFKYAALRESEKVNELTEKWYDIIDSVGRDTPEAKEAWDKVVEAEKEFWEERQKAIDKACDMLKVRFFNLWD